MFRKIKNAWNSLWGNKSSEGEDTLDSPDYHFEEAPQPAPAPQGQTARATPVSAPRKQSDRGLTNFEVGVTLAVWLVWFAISTIVYMNNPGAPIDIGQIMYGLLAAHIALSCRIVSSTELGVVERLGNPDKRNVNSGPVLVPFLFFSLKKETKLRIQFQIPDEPEFVDKTGNDVPAEGKVFPIRVTHATRETAIDGDNPIYKDDPLHVRMTTEWLVAIWMQITDYSTFLQVIGSRENAKAQLRDVAEATLKAYCGRYTPAQIIPRMDKVRNTLRTNLDKLVLSWGVIIPEIALTEMDLGKTINEKLRSIPAAKLQKAITVRNAEAAREATLLEGQALARNRELFLDKEGAMIARNRRILLEAEAVGAKALAEVMKTDEGRVAAQLEALRAALHGANYSILPGDSLYPLLSGLKNALSETGQKPTSTEANVA